MAEVLCFPRRHIGNLSGLVSLDSAYELICGVDTDRTFIERSVAEELDEHVQLIACAVITTGKGLYEVFETPSKQSYDADGPVSLIIGGHIDRRHEFDMTRPMGSLVHETLQREMVEELGRSDAQVIRTVGFVIDRSAFKNSRHVGILHECRLEGPVRPVSAKEFTLNSQFAGTRTVDQLRDMRDRMDPWSRIFTDSL